MITVEDLSSCCDQTDRLGLLVRDWSSLHEFLTNNSWSWVHTSRGGRHVCTFCPPRASFIGISNTINLARFKILRTTETTRFIGGSISVVGPLYSFIDQFVPTRYACIIVSCPSTGRHLRHPIYGQVCEGGTHIISSTLNKVLGLEMLTTVLTSTVIRVRSIFRSADEIIYKKPQTEHFRYTPTENDWHSWCEIREEIPTNRLFFLKIFNRQINSGYLRRAIGQPRTGRISTAAGHGHREVLRQSRRNVDCQATPVRRR